MRTVWKIAPGAKAAFWEMCRGKQCIVIGWLNKRDLRTFRSKDAVLKALVKSGEGEHRAANSIWRFVHDVQPFHVVVANRGLSTVVGIGVIKGDYLPPGSPNHPNIVDDLPHARFVDWLIDKPIDLPHERFFVQDTVWPLTPEQCAQIKEAYLQEYPELKETLKQLFPSEQSPSPAPCDEAKMKSLLKQLGQVIVYGPPGTGKTREAKRVALSLLTGKDFEDSGMTDGDIEGQLRPFRDAGRFELVVFHPAYEYEQFVGGIEPTVIEQQLSFRAKPGIFTVLCRKAEETKESAVLIIDEINRGLLPKLLGELVYALKYRDHEVKLPFDDGRSHLIVPKNLYIIATMNSADHSIGRIDVAIRRRFGLYPLGAQPEVVQRIWASSGDAAYGDQLADLMNRLNSKLGDEQDPGARIEQQVGHSYFLPAQGSSGDIAREQVSLKWKYQVQPLLREYVQMLNPGPDSLRAFLNESLDACLLSNESW